MNFYPLYSSFNKLSLFLCYAVYDQGGSCEIASKNDVKDYRDLTGAMDILGFSTQEQETIYKLLASVLHIGNIFFTKVQVLNSFVI